MTRARTMMILALGLAWGAAAHAQTQPQNARDAEEGLMHASDQGVTVLGRGALAHPDVPPGYVIVEGDIQMPIAQFEAMLAGVDSTFGTVAYWNVTVPYDFVTSGGGAVSAANQTAAIDAMNAVAAQAGLIFRPAVAGDANRIRFQNSSFNNSPVGVQGGVQIINITSWGTQIIICHEIYHSLGFWHEQSRGDRGTYITINTNNICGSGISNACTAGTGAGQCCGCTNSGGTCVSCAFNFNVQSGALTYGPYDFDSFMHYGAGAFSCNGGNTITCNAGYTQYQATIGQRDHFSYFDALTCRGIYRFNGDVWWDPFAANGGSGNLPSAWNGTFQNAVTNAQTGGTLFIKNAGNYSAIGTYNKAITIRAPLGATLGN